MMSDETESFTIEVGYASVNGCDQTFEEYLEDVEYVSVYLLVSNEILDHQNFEDPVQTYIDDQNIILIDPRQFSFNYLHIVK